MTPFIGSPPITTVGFKETIIPKLSPETELPLSFKIPSTKAPILGSLTRFQLINYILIVYALPL